MKKLLFGSVLFAVLGVGALYAGNEGHDDEYEVTEDGETSGISCLSSNDCKDGRTQDEEDGKIVGCCTKSVTGARGHYHS